MILYYARLSADQIARLREDPLQLFNLEADTAFAGTELTDVDTIWEVIAWLISPRKRVEHLLTMANYAANTRHSSSTLPDTVEAFAAIEKEEQARLGVTLTDVNQYPVDLPLVAIEGRGAESQRDPAIEFGIGGARIFTPSEVVELVKALDLVKPEDLRRAFNRQELHRLAVGNLSWLEEPDALFDGLVTPELARLTEFYRRAAAARQHVLAVFA